MPKNTTGNLSIDGEKIMIRLTRLNGSEIYLNPDLIEALEETPDTQITLSNGQHYVVRESIRMIRDRIISFNARIIRRGCSGHCLRGRRHRLCIMSRRGRRS